MSRDGNLRLAAANLWTLAMLALQAFALTVNSVAAPWIMESFRLNQSSLARLFAVISVSAIGALILTRLFDVIGRGRMLRWWAIPTSLGAIGASLSHRLISVTRCRPAASRCHSPLLLPRSCVVCRAPPAGVVYFLGPYRQPRLPPPQRA